MLCFKLFTVLIYFCTSVFIYICFVGFLLISCTFCVRHLSFNKTAIFAPRVLKLCTWCSVLLESKKSLQHVGSSTETFIFHLIQMNFEILGGL